jgi:hypothetical protein
MSGRSDIAAVLAGCCLALVGGTIDAAAPAIAARSATAPQQLVNQYPLGPQRLCCGGQSGSSTQSGSTEQGGSRSTAGGAGANGPAQPLGKPARHGNSGGLSPLLLIIFGAAAAALVGGVAAIYRTRRIPADEHRAEVGRADAGDAGVSRPSQGQPEALPEPGEAVGAFDLEPLVKERAAPDGAPAVDRESADRGHDRAKTNLGVLPEDRRAVDEDEVAYVRAVEHGAAAVSLNLAVLLEEQGDLIAAEEAYRRAEERGEAEISNIARAALLDLRRGLHEPDTVRTANEHDA